MPQEPELWPGQQSDLVTTVKGINPEVWAWQGVVGHGSAKPMSLLPGLTRVFYQWEF